ncbi:hypothetical protein BJY01DRAFT_227728 [Aspergillus pseudoustus]|uniref:Uncharacterized protein n=1 Tax=Aspergillus pseudoustus TaxID=1810923 RepID=A0ABR4IQ12_9EURO
MFCTHPSAIRRLTFSFASSCQKLRLCLSTSRFYSLSAWAGLAKYFAFSSFFVYLKHYHILYSLDYYCRIINLIKDLYHLSAFSSSNQDSLRVAPVPTPTPLLFQHLPARPVPLFFPRFPASHADLACCGLQLDWPDGDKKVSWTSMSKGINTSS